MKKPKYHTQPEWLGGKRVLSKNVPDNYYSIFSVEEDPSNAYNIIVMKHENNMYLTSAQIKKFFNTFGTKKEASAALRVVRKAYRGKL